MTAARFERICELCADLDAAIQMAKESRAPVRVMMLIELARDDLRRSIDQIEQGNNVVELGLRGKK